MKNLYINILSAVLICFSIQANATVVDIDSSTVQNNVSLANRDDYQINVTGINTSSATGIYFTNTTASTPAPFDVNLNILPDASLTSSYDVIFSIGVYSSPIGGTFTINNYGELRSTARSGIELDAPKGANLSFNNYNSLTCYGTYGVGFTTYAAGSTGSIYNYDGATIASGGHAIYMNSAYASNFTIVNNGTLKGSGAAAAAVYVSTSGTFDFSNTGSVIHNSLTGVHINSANGGVFTNNGVITGTTWSLYIVGYVKNTTFVLDSGSQLNGAVEFLSGNTAKLLVTANGDNAKNVVGNVTLTSATFSSQLINDEHYGQLNSTAKVALSTGSTKLLLDLDHTNAGGMEVGDTFDIIRSNTITGTFNGYANGSTYTDGDYSFLVIYNSVAGDSYVRLTALAVPPQVIPEPAEVALVTGILLLGFAGLKKKKFSVKKLS